MVFFESLLLQKNVHSNKFLVYICDKVLPVLDLIENPTEEPPADTEGDAKPAPPSVDMQLDMLKLFAELAAFCGPLEDGEEKVKCVFDKLIVSFSNYNFVSF